jgi:hypothetical protein
MPCRARLTLTGAREDETYQCERTKKGHRKHWARIVGADRDGSFVGKMKWWRP